MSAFDDLPVDLVMAFAAPNRGPDEILFEDSRIRIERKNNVVTTTGVGEIKMPTFIYERNDA